MPDYTSTYRTLLSLFDYTGTWSKPFEDAGWNVIRWDIQLDEFMDINLLEDAEMVLNMFENVDGILAAAPCTDFASSGARWFKAKDEAGQTEESMEIVRQVMRLVDLFEPTDPDYEGTWFWVIENPVGRLNTLFPDLPKPRYFQPYEYAGYLNVTPAQKRKLDKIREKDGKNVTAAEADLILDTNTYTKKTGLWGEFNMPKKKPIPPVPGSAQGSVMQRFGGCSIETKNVRSMTPEGFAKAFYQANKNRAWNPDDDIILIDESIEETISPAAEKRKSKARARARARIRLLELNEKKELTVLSFGGGQDSTALLYEAIYNPKFAAKYIKGDFLVIMANTGNEHRQTYEHVKKVMDLCLKHGIRFEFLQPDQWATESWSGGLLAKYERDKTIPMAGGVKSCTVSLKLQPIYNFLDSYVHQVYQTKKSGRKAALKEFAKTHGKINVIVGIAAKEETRISNPEDQPKWMQQSINLVYPLVDLGVDRAGAQAIIQKYGHPVPLPSNCMICPFMSMQELLWLYRFEPEMYAKMVRLEKDKLEKTERIHEFALQEDWEGAAAAGASEKLIASLKEKGVRGNQGIFGNKTVPERLEKAQKKYGHWTDEELYEYKMSHGHCVKSKY